MSNDNNNKPEAEKFPLDEHMITFVMDTQRRIFEAQHNLNGALMLFMRQHSLPGHWQIAENGREIVRVPDPAPVTK